MIQPTRRLGWCITALAAAHAVGIAVEPVRWAAFAGDLILLMFVAADLFAAPRKLQFEVERRLPDRALRGEEFKIRYVIKRTAGFARANVELRDDFPAAVEFIDSDKLIDSEAVVTAAPGESTTIERRLMPRVRGAAVFNNITIRAGSPFQLWRLQFTKTIDVQLPIDPEPKGLVEGLRRVHTKQREQGFAMIRVRGRATSFEQLRDHIDGDEFRTVDWKATARRGKLTVREYKTERNREISILIDAGRRMGSSYQYTTKLDSAIETALGLARVGLEAGDRVGLVTFASKPLFEIPARRGIPHFRNLYESVRHLAPMEYESNLLSALHYHRVQHRKRAFLLIFTDLHDPVSARRLIPAFASAARRHYVLFVAIDDPERRAIEESSIQQIDNAYLVAGARRLRRERIEVLADLRRHGVHCVDALPNEITGPVLDTYLSASERELF
ncbi:MAG: DUF58 domain-containing protein [Planctomycetota bacterium]